MKLWYGGCHGERNTYCFDMIGEDSTKAEDVPGVLSQ